MKYNELIEELIVECREALDDAAPRSRRDQLLVEAAARALARIQPEPFIEWVKENRDLCAFYYDVQESGTCAKPLEVAALILEAIARDAVEE